MLLPKAPSDIARRLGQQSVLFSAGEGAFNTGSAVFFTQVVGLSATQVGLGITIGGLVKLAVAIASGRLADRYGALQVWSVSAWARAALFLTWPFLHGFGAFLAMLVVFQFFNDLGGAGWRAYSISAVPTRERVPTQAYTYSILNVGFTVGAGLGGLALAIPGHAAIRFLPALTAAISVANALMLRSLPRVRQTREAEELAAPVPAPGALRNRGFVLSAFFSGVLNTNQVLLNVVIPLWLVEATDAPRVLLAWLFGTNTVLCIFLPKYVAGRGRDIDTALKAASVSTAFFVGSCLITLVTHGTAGWVTILLVWLGHLTVTGAELFLAPFSWALPAYLADPDRRGEYMGVLEFGGAAGSVWAPALFTWLALDHGAPGWLAIAGIALVATAGLVPATRAAQRFVVRHELDPTR